MQTIEVDPRTFPFLKSLSPAAQAVLLENATLASYRAGQIIFREGEPANRFFLIEEGHVAVEVTSPRHDNVTVQTLGPGDALGWSWLFEPFTWKFQARAVDSAQLLVFDAAHLLRISNENHEFGYELMKRLARVVIGDLQATRQRLVDRTNVTPSPHAA